MNVPSIETRSDQDRAKLAAGRFAAEKYAFDGAKLGLGSGTTSHYFVRALAQRVAEGLDVVGATTSTSTTELARELGVPLADIDDIDRLDVCIDGPDEIDVEGNQIKGGGACLLWEKLVVMKADKSVVVADHTKAVPRLGRFPLPIEIVRYAPGTTTAAIRTLLTENGYPADLELVRRSRNGEEVITDNGNYIVDAHLGKVRDIGRLTVELNRIPGVVENGFFYGTVDEVVFGWPDGSAGIFDFPFGLPLNQAMPETTTETNHQPDMGPPAQEVEDTMTAVSIPKTMKASVLHGIKNIKVEDRDVPQPGEGEVLIKINAVGVCGSDTHYYLEGRIGDFVVDGPLILGHESSGTVVSVGAGVDEAKVGQRVAIEGGIPKPYSREVMGGFYNLDPDIAFHATPPYDGTLCDYVVMPQEFVFDLPDNVSDEAGALLEPLSVAIAANKAGQVGLGSHVLISGSGPIGLLVAAVARLSGATYVQVVDLREERLETALKYGAHVATRPEAVDRDDFDVFVDATGAPPAISAGIPHLRTAGRAVLVGMGADTIELPLPLLQVRGIEVISQFRYKNTWPTAVEIAAAGLVDLDGMVTSTFGLDGVAEALVVGGEPGQIKAVVKP